MFDTNRMHPARSEGKTGVIISFSLYIIANFFSMNILVFILLLPLLHMTVSSVCFIACLGFDVSPSLLLLHISEICKNFQFIGIKKCQKVPVVIRGGDKNRETYRSIKHQKQKFNILPSFPYLPTTDNSFRRVLTEVLAEVFLYFPTQVIVATSWKNPWLSTSPCSQWVVIMRLANV